MNHATTNRWYGALAAIAGLLWPCHVVMAQMAGTASQVLLTTTPVPGRAGAPVDFNDDGVSDLLWYDPRTSRLAYWLIDTDASGSVTRTGSRIFSIPAGTSIGGAGDFDGDGYADIATTDSAGSITLWMNDHAGGFRHVGLGNYPAGWRLFGAGDINADGSDDLLWIDDAGCQFGYWTMVGGRRTGAVILPIPCGSRPLSIGYYALDGHLSIAWTNPAHDLAIWDFTATGRNVSQLGNYGASSSFLAFGGGYAGAGMSFIRSPAPGEATAEVMERTFGIDGRQASFVLDLDWTGGINTPEGPGGFLIDSRNQLDKTGPIYTTGTDSVAVCPPVSAGGYPESGPTATASACIAFATSGWLLVGADWSALQ